MLPRNSLSHDPYRTKIPRESASLIEPEAPGQAGSPVHSEIAAKWPQRSRTAPNLGPRHTQLAPHENPFPGTGGSQQLPRRNPPHPPRLGSHPDRPGPLEARASLLCTRAGPVRVNSAQSVLGPARGQVGIESHNFEKRRNQLVIFARAVGVVELPHDFTFARDFEGSPEI